MSSRVHEGAAAAFALFAVGIAVQPLHRAATAAMSGVDSGIWAGDVSAAAGGDASTAVLGGLRALVADAIWLRAYGAWAAHDLKETEALIRLVTLIDGRPTAYWLNGARMLAYDGTQWRLAAGELGGIGRRDSAHRIREEQATKALALLYTGWRRHPLCADFPVEMANINWNVRQDIAAAAECYRLASEVPGAPYYAARIHGELLKRMGRLRDAHAWLCRVCPGLPIADEHAMREVIVRRIRELEDLLDMPPDERYRDSICYPSPCRPKDD